MSIRLALGVPKAGKTLALQDMVHDAALDGHTLFVRDLAGEWRQEDPEAPGRPNPRWRDAPPELVDAPDPDSGDLLSELEEHRDAGGRVVLFGWPWEGRDIAQCCLDVGNVNYVDDEIDTTATYTDAWEENPIREFAHRGRHLPNAEGVIGKVHVFGACRRPQSLHIDVTSLADEVMLFRVQGHRTIKRVLDEGWIDQSMVDELRTLPNLHFFKWESTGEIHRGFIEGFEGGAS